MVRKIRIEAFKKFCDLVETQNIVRTANRNSVSVSAIKQQIRSLEDAFSRCLIERIGVDNKFRLTQAGRIFYRESRNVLASYDALCEKIRERADLIYPPVKIAAVYSVGLYVLPETMREFMRKFPQAAINLEYSRAPRVVREVLSEEIDLGIVAFPEPRREFEIVPLKSDRLVLICPPDHDCARRDRIEIEELAGTDFVQFDRDLPTAKAIAKILKARGVAAGSIAEFGNVEMIKCAVESGRGTAIVPASTVAREKATGRLAVVELVGNEWARPVGAIYRRNREPSRTAKKFLQLLKDRREE